MFGRSISCLSCGRPARVGMPCICGFEWAFVQSKGYFYRWKCVDEDKIWGSHFRFIHVPEGCLAVFQWKEE